MQQELQTTKELADLFGDALPGEGVAAAARIYLKSRREKEHAEAEVKRLSSQLQTAESLLFQKLDEARLLSVKVDEGDGQAVLVSTHNKTSYSMPSGGLSEHDSLHQWLIVVGGGDLIRDNVNPQSFSAFCREIADQGGAIHHDVKTFTRRVVAVRKG
jgi:hypothetical protein